MTRSTSRCPPSWPRSSSVTKQASTLIITAMEEIQRHYGYLAADHLRYLA
ncbi:MAG: hypothetical protein R2856_22115 [Caldilineaceae bacterium]